MRYALILVVAAVFINGCTKSNPTASKPVDLSGNWLLTNPKQQYNVELRSVGENRYRLIGEAPVYAGVYELRQDTLVMTEPALRDYAGFVWKISTADKLELTNTEYKGSTLSRQASR